MEVTFKIEFSTLRKIHVKVNGTCSKESLAHIREGTNVFNYGNFRKN